MEVRSVVSGPSGSSSSLIQWIQQSDGYISSSLELQGREVKVVKAIPASSLVATIPKSCQLRTNSASDPDLESVFSQLPVGSKSGEAGAWAYRLAVLLLWQLKTQRSHLHPHLAMLPGLAKNAVTPRIGFNLSKVSEAQYLPLIEAILNQQFFSASFYEDVLAKLPTDHLLSKVTRSELDWSLACTSSRSFAVNSGLQGYHAMPPFIDMIDHDPGRANVEVKIEADGTFKLSTSCHHLMPGDTLILSYGNLDNLNLILSFGFMIRDNPNDKFEFYFSSVLQAIPLLVNPELTEAASSEWKINLLNELEVLPYASHPESPAKNQPTSVSRVFFRAPSPQNPSPVDPKLLLAIQILLSSGDKQEDLEQEVLRFISGSSNLVSWPPSGQLSPIADILDILSKLALVLYEGMGSTLQQDIAELKRLTELPEKDLDEILVVNFRIEIKRTLEKALLAIRNVKKSDP